MITRIAYFTNVYPAVSHSFIRREILAVERQGMEVLRIALRGWNEDVVDEQDRAEQAKTRYLLKDGALPLVGAVLRMLFTSPRKWFRALTMACRQAIESNRALVYHILYFAEACHMVFLFRRAEIQHVHAHFGTNPAEIVMIARLLGGPPYSFTVHGPEEFDSPRALHLRDKVRYASSVVAISSFARSQLFRWADLADWPKIHVVRCGVDQQFLGVDRTPVPDSGGFVCVGRLCEQKGQLLLLEAFRSVLASGTKANLILGGDGEMRAVVEKQIQQLGVGENVRVTGWISGAEVRDEILSARALVIASFAEGLPVVLMEAMALWRPVIVTCIAGVPELVEHGRSGWIVPAGNKDALADALRDCAAASTDELSRMAKHGRERVAVLHDVDIEAKRLYQLFNT